MNILDIDEPFINVSQYAETDLGKMLSPGYPISLQTLFGKIGTIRSAMEYIVTPNYPERLLSKRKLKRDEISTIPKNKIDVPNYWAVIAYLLCLRVKSDDKLIEMLSNIEEDTKFVSYNKVTKNTLGIKSVTYKQNLTMNMYLHIIDSIVRVIKQGVFNDRYIQSIIISYKDDKNKSVFEGLAVAVESDI